MDDVDDNSASDKNSKMISLKKASSRVLNKLARKLDLDQTIASWNDKLGSEKEGMFDWIKILQKIDDNKLKKIVGTDAALYLVLLKYSSMFFGFISCINLVFIWIYITGEPDPRDDFNSDHND